ncbi:uncharacterized protein LOC133801132 isoform X1 [Humulus lupulus]|uniref:uncharacterized protein LOC133801132 isoform X1 n=1 Tax=Humulus lupulus TaxID=3486 RepID=UPI002B4140ED|nr:uncharacterized protein LOC133801132 isoform X1 [Humulus lupulus]
MKHSLAIHNPNITVILIAAGVSHEPSSSPSSLPSPLPPFILYIHYYLFFSVVGPEDNPSEVHFADDGVESYLEEVFPYVQSNLIFIFVRIIGKILTAFVLYQLQQRIMSKRVVVVEEEIIDSVFGQVSYSI